MVRQVNPPLSSEELEGAATAAAAIITRCNMDSTDGFVAADKLFSRLDRKTTRSLAFEFSFNDTCAALAHSSIRSILETYGCKFERNRMETDKFIHRGECYWMNRLGRSAGGHELPAMGSSDEQSLV
jgi:hypothetical protein